MQNQKELPNGREDRYPILWAGLRRAAVKPASEVPIQTNRAVDLDSCRARYRRWASQPRAPGKIIS